MDIQEELNGVLCWIAVLLILLLQWLYLRVLRSHVLSRMFYDHLTLSCDLTCWVPILFIFLLCCMLWGFGLSVQIHGKPFPVWGSHNIPPWLFLPSPIFWTQNFLSIFLWYSFYYIFSSTPPILYAYCSSLSCCIFSPFPCFEIATALYIFQMLS